MARRDLLLAVQGDAEQALYRDPDGEISDVQSWERLLSLLEPRHDELNNRGFLLFKLGDQLYAPHLKLM